MLPAGRHEDAMTENAIAAIAAGIENARPVAPVISSHRSPPNDVYTQFEAALLSILVEAALPKGKAAYGAGLAGQLARTELARHLGGVIATHGTLGLRASLEAARKQPL